MWINLSAYGNHAELDDIILNKGKLWLDSGLMFGAGGEGFWRINVACPRSVLLTGLNRLAECIAQYYSSIKGNL